MKIADIYDKPFSYANLSEEDFAPIDKLVGQSISIKDVQTFENDKGPGVYILFEKNGKLSYTTTHSIGITKILSSDKASEALEQGETIECTVMTRRSKADASKTVFTLQ